MKIRRAKEPDALKLAKLMSSIIKATPHYTAEAKKEEIRKHSLASLKSYLKDRKYYVCLVAVERKNLIGFALGRNEAGVFWADWVGVKSGFRRKGVAESLMKAWEKYLKKAGIHKIWCDTRTTNKESLSLLRKLQYRKLGKFDNGWYRQDFFLWEKDL